MSEPNTRQMLRDMGAEPKKRKRKDTCSTNFHSFNDYGHRDLLTPETRARLEAFEARTEK